MIGSAEILELLNSSPIHRLPGWPPIGSECGRTIVIGYATRKTSSGNRSVRISRCDCGKYSITCPTSYLKSACKACSLQAGHAVMRLRRFELRTEFSLYPTWIEKYFPQEKNKGIDINCISINSPKKITLICGYCNELMETSLASQAQNISSGKPPGHKDCLRKFGLFSNIQRKRLSELAKTHSAQDEFDRLGASRIASFSKDNTICLENSIPGSSESCKFICTLVCKQPFTTKIRYFFDRLRKEKTACPNCSIVVPYEQRRLFHRISGWCDALGLELAHNKHIARKIPDFLINGKLIIEYDGGGHLKDIQADIDRDKNHTKDGFLSVRIRSQTLLAYPEDNDVKIILFNPHIFDDFITQARDNLLPYIKQIFKPTGD